MNTESYIEVDTMTVGELIDALSELPPDLEVRIEGEIAGTIEVDLHECIDFHAVVDDDDDWDEEDDIDVDEEEELMDDDI